jgi:uncharacterized protein (TIGR03067 family)
MATLLLIAATLMIPTPPFGDDSAQETKKLNGTWKMEKMEINGQDMPESVYKEFKLVLQDGKYDVQARGTKDSGTVQVDAGKKPKTMEIHGKEGPNQGKTMRCIYELKGDVLKICYDLGGKEFPKEFSAPANSNRMLAEYKRGKE